MTPHALTFTRTHADLTGVCSCGQWDALAIGHNHHAQTALTRDWAEHQEAACMIDPTLESPASSGIPFFWRDRRPQGGTCSLVREIDTPTTRRWLYRVEPAVRYTTDFSDYADGDLTTEYLVVSQGRAEDTAVFPADETGRILDMLGFGSTFMGWWIDPNVMLTEVGFDLDVEATA